MGSIQSGYCKRFTLVMAAMQLAMLATPHMVRAEALVKVGGYESRGKGRARSPFAASNGASISQRGAQKKRNQARHRAACRG